MKVLNRFIQTGGPLTEQQQMLLHSIFLSFAHKHGLTPRETQALRILVTDGPHNEEMALALDISPKTLKNHLACMMKKTDTGSSRSLQALFFKHTMKMLLPS